MARGIGNLGDAMSPRLLTEMPELFADLDVPAHGSHHTVPKARRAVG